MSTLRHIWSCAGLTIKDWLEEVDLIDPDLTLRQMKSSVKGLLWRISCIGARSDVKGRQNSNSAMLNDWCLLNVVTDQYTGENINNCHPRPVPTPQICLILSLKWRSLSICTWLLQWVQRCHVANSGDIGGKSATWVQSECTPTASRRQAMKLHTFCSPTDNPDFSVEHGPIDWVPPHWNTTPPESAVMSHLSRLGTWGKLSHSIYFYVLRAKWSSR